MDEPQYKPPKRFPWSATVACFGIVLILACVLPPVFREVIRQTQDYNQSSRCATIIKNQLQAQLTYAADYDSHLPLATSWQITTKPYRPRQDMGYGESKALPFRCPDVEATRHSPSIQGTGYAMDSRLSAASLLAQTTSHNETHILLFESSNLSKNANSPGTDFLARHRSYGGLVGLTDGSMRFLKESQRSVVERGTP